MMFTHDKRLGMTIEQLQALAVSDDADNFKSAIDFGLTEIDTLTERERQQLRMLQLFAVAAIGGANREVQEFGAEPIETIIIATMSAARAIGFLAAQSFEQRGNGKVCKTLTETFRTSLRAVLDAPRVEK